MDVLNTMPHSMCVYVFAWHVAIKKYRLMVAEIKVPVFRKLKATITSVCLFKVWCVSEYNVVRFYHWRADTEIIVLLFRELRATKGYFFKDWCTSEYRVERFNHWSVQKLKSCSFENWELRKVISLKSGVCPNGSVHVSVAHFSHCQGYPSL